MCRRVDPPRRRACGLPLAWDAIVDWLVDGGIGEAEAWRDDRWQQVEWRRSETARAEFCTQLEAFAAGRTKRELFESGQSRGISVAPVATPDDLLRDPQLLARDFFQTIDVDGNEVAIPGSPYRFRTSDVRPRWIRFDEEALQGGR